jgi:hypothetical protein
VSLVGLQLSTNEFKPMLHSVGELNQVSLIQNPNLRVYNMNYEAVDYTDR